MSMQSEPVARANVPTEDFLEEIHTLAVNLVPANNSGRVVDGKVREAEGSIEAILVELGQRLTEDVESHRQEKGPYDVEYVAIYDSETKSGLHVLTRLYSRTESDKGSVFYGSLVLRTGIERFELWVDPEE